MVPVLPELALRRKSVCADKNMTSEFRQVRVNDLEGLAYGTLVTVRSAAHRERQRGLGTETKTLPPPLAGQRRQNLFDLFDIHRFHQVGVATCVLRTLPVRILAITG